MAYKEDINFKKLRLTLSKTLTGCLIKQPITKKKKSCGNKSKNLAIVSRPFLVSIMILVSSFKGTFLKESHIVGFKVHILRNCSTVSNWPHSQ